MATKEAIKDALYDDLKAIISEETSVSDPSDHVGLLDNESDANYPFLGFESWGNPVEKGLDGSVHVDHIEYDDSGDAQRIVYRRDYRLWTDIGVVADDHDAHLKDALYTAVQDHLSQFQSYKNPEDFHSDVGSLSDEGYQNYDGEDASIVGDRLQYTFTYGRYTSYSDFAPLRTVKTDIEAIGYEGTPLYIEESVQ